VPKDDTELPKAGKSTLDVVMPKVEELDDI